MKYGLVDRPFHFSPDFTRTAVAVFVVHQQVREIAVPEIAGKAMAARHFQKTMHAVIQKGALLLNSFFTASVMLHQPYHIHKETGV